MGQSILNGRGIGSPGEGETAPKADVRPDLGSEERYYTGGDEGKSFRCNGGKVVEKNVEEVVESLSGGQAL